LRFRNPWVQEAHQTQPPVQSGPASYPRAKQPGRGANHVSPSRVKVKNELATDPQNLFFFLFSFSLHGVLCGKESRHTECLSWHTAVNSETHACAMCRMIICKYVFILPTYYVRARKMYLKHYSKMLFFFLTLSISPCAWSTIYIYIFKVRPSRTHMI
jgi:hypothetical protein